MIGEMRDSKARSIITRIETTDPHRLNLYGKNSKARSIITRIETGGEMIHSNVPKIFQSKIHYNKD
ncbi:MAG: hypothetical protein PWR29_1087 [Methanolobus sp.]|nr:hypothetical protein [Methanolobus sp.]